MSCKNIFKECFMKNKFVFALVFAFVFVIRALPLSAQKYVNGAKYKFYTQANVNSGNGYRTLRLQPNSEWVIDDIGLMMYVSASTAGDPNIIEILEISDKPDRKYKQWKVGEKTTIQALTRDDKNVEGYKIRTPGNAYWVEFVGTGYPDVFTKVDNRKFGVILPNSEVRIYSGGSSVWIDSGAIGWDDEFMYANNLDDYMRYLAEKVDYNTVKSLADKKKFDSLKTDAEKKNYCADLVTSIATGAGVWGAIWGAAPPWLLPLEFANVLAQFTAQSYMAAVIGYLHGYYPNGGAAFQQQLKLDNYILFAGSKTLAAETLKGMAESARDTVIQEAAKFLMTELAPRATGVIKSIPVIGTVWGVGKGGYDGMKGAIEMGTRAYFYFSKPPEEFLFDTLAKTITRYNGVNGKEAKSVVIPGKIDNVNVEIIKAGAFESKTTIESVTLGENLKTIEANAFKNCTSLKTITLPKIIRNFEIKDGAFSGCAQLASVIIPPDIIALVEQTRIKITFGAGAFNGTKLDDASKIALRKLGYIGAGVGPEPAPKGFIVQNNTGSAIVIIERKNRSNWTSILSKSVANGSKSEVINLSPGTYDLRVITPGDFPNNSVYEKNAVNVTDGMTVTFTASDKYNPTRAEYQAYIQTRCNFGNARDVWRAMDTHSSADSLYKAWAESYPNNSDHRYPSPRVGYSGSKYDKEIIQAQCKFNNQQVVWDAVAKHKFPDSVLQVWANSYYTGSQATPEPVAAPAPKPAATPAPAPKPAPTPAPAPAKPAAAPAPKLTNADYQKTIQARCSYQNPPDVWKAVDKLSSGDRDRVYKAWAEGYNRSKPSSSQKNKSDKDLILDMCPDIKGISANVWKTIEANFANYNGLYKKWADSYRNM
jgi:hypothetical protein